MPRSPQLPLPVAQADADKHADCYAFFDTLCDCHCHDYANLDAFRDAINNRERKPDECSDSHRIALAKPKWLTNTIAE